MLDFLRKNREPRTGIAKTQENPPELTNDPELLGQSQESKGSDIVFPKISRFAQAMQTRTWLETNGNNLKETRLEAIANIADGSWTIVQHKVVHETATTAVLSKGINYQEALQQMLDFELGIKSFHALPDENPPENYFLSVAEYDGIVLDTNNKFHVTQNGRILTTGQFEQDALKRVAEKTALPTEQLREGFSFTTPQGGSDSLKRTFGLYAATKTIGTSQAISETTIQTLEDYLAFEGVRVKAQKTLQVFEEIIQILSTGLMMIDNFSVLRPILPMKEPDYLENSDKKARDSGPWRLEEDKSTQYSFKKNAFCNTVDSYMDKDGVFALEKTFSQEFQSLSKQAYKDALRASLLFDLRLCFLSLTQGPNPDAVQRIKNIKTGDPWADFYNSRPKVENVEQLIVDASSDFELQIPFSLFVVRNTLKEMLEQMAQKTEQAHRFLSQEKEPATTEHLIIAPQAVASRDAAGKTSYVWYEAQREGDEWIIESVSYQPKTPSEEEPYLERNKTGEIEKSPEAVRENFKRTIRAQREGCVFVPVSDILSHITMIEKQRIEKLRLELIALPDEVRERREDDYHHEMQSPVLSRYSKPSSKPKQRTGIHLKV